ncbi:FtsB family cell division protein [Thermoactinomyces mirandus]|uniref:Septum formation initiator family protein n=1 Tax=Thermoactinomyces mirandus TaxID=2756294 RepID=A0A7W1XQF9_9BACL|nr:septum formation initiator family protein [Thermoactinomyces mirandus]MBA4601260.1 septum formation initiator family protein [Thermoactinomyces mirandus]
MPFQHGKDKILTFQRPLNPDRQQKPQSSPKPVRPLHPAVRRRRMIWLVIVVVFICWAVIQSFIQQLRVWEQEKELAAKQEQLAQLQLKQKELKQEVQKLKSEDYMLELAHKMGYGKPGEEIYSLEKKESE